jgi:DNA-3-methyladenine glycosylase I
MLEIPAATPRPRDQIRDSAMNFPYRLLFQQVEASLLDYGSREKIQAQLDVYKTKADQQLTDDRCFSTLVYVTFYSGFRAATVTARRDAIRRWFPDWRTVAGYSDEQVGAIMSDEGMIRNRKKITACIENAKVIGKLVQEHGSLAQYIASFSPKESFENLLLLKEELEGRFHYLGGTTVYHFLTDIGMPVLKPDRVICRIFKRLGLIDSEEQLLKAVIQGRKFAEATELPIRYIDRVFVAYGQVQTPGLGIDRGICLKQPRCSVCGIKSFCRWYQRERGV